LRCIAKNQILFVKKKDAIEFDEAKYQKRLKSAIDDIKKCKSLKTYVARYDYFRSYSTVKDYLLMPRLSQSTICLIASISCFLKWITNFLKHHRGFCKNLCIWKKRDVQKREDQLYQRNDIVYCDNSRVIKAHLYKHQENEHQGKEIPFGDGSPWEFAEVLYKSFMELTVQVNDLEQELMLLKHNPHLQNPSPKPMTEACCQTRTSHGNRACSSKFAKAHDQVHLSQEEDILYQSVYEKTRQKRENGDREREEHTSPQTQTKDP